MDLGGLESEKDVNSHAKHPKRICRHEPTLLSLLSIMLRLALITHHWIRVACTLQVAEEFPEFTPERPIIVATFVRIFPHDAKNSNLLNVFRFSSSNRMKVAKTKTVAAIEIDDMVLSTTIRVQSWSIVR
jgi:hypothetical protein